MRIALCQMRSTEDKEVNYAEMRRLTGLAAGEDADLVVFPEWAMFELATMSSAFVAAAEPIDGPFVNAVAKLAREYQVTIVFGAVEIAEVEGRACNSLVAIGPDGSTLAIYRKQHLYDAFGFHESDFICPGPTGQAVTLKVADTVIGLLICYDLRFPEAARLVVDAGADVILYPASWVPGPRKEDHWSVLARARAIENTVFVAALSQAPPMGTGGSLIVDPMGLVVGELGEGIDILVRDIDPARIDTVRASNPSLANRRYGITASA